MPPFLPFYYLCHINPQKIMELLNYFYHPNYTSTELSNLWITDNTGRPIQHLHYLPFGEDWVDQRNSSWNAPYTFSGKEKDVETGYGYVKKLRFFSSLAFGNEKQVFHYAHCLRRFGARYYDSGLSIWLSVDPMSDKYPSMSPYNYCANNPIILVDPDGKMISVMFNHVKYTLSGGKVYVNGNEFTGELPKFVQTVNRSINIIKSTSIGKEVVESLEKDISQGGPDIIFAESYDNENHYRGDIEDGELVKATIYLSENSSNKAFISKKESVVSKQALVFRRFLTGSIMHELAHAYTDYTKTTMNGSYKDLDLSEWQACYYENMFYLQNPKFGFLRSHYNTTFDPNYPSLEHAADPVLLEGMSPIDPRTINN